MAKIIWQKRASRVLDKRLAYANAEFGKSTAKRWIKEIAYAEERIASMPISYTPEPLLAGKKHVYRYCHLMNRRFKLIYCYYFSSNIVRVVDIWDTRVDPETLKRRIK
ncbi:MAG: type II toxin-antitoxin system RelE/ParE family toxin [Prevotella sp.]|nr:type II toxin-antitoxin system RelE/ParE family toxin [Prevotella sp.]